VRKLESRTILFAVSKRTRKFPPTPNKEIGCPPLASAQIYEIDGPIGRWMAGLRADDWLAPTLELLGLQEAPHG